MSFSQLVIPVFVAHQGCPHRCIFCDQHAIIGNNDGRQAVTLTPAGVIAVIDTWLARPRRFPGARVQVAFYGGSFTGMDQARQKELLRAVNPYLADGRVDALRLSTRPDYVVEETPAFLSRHGVEVVELGVQSMQDEVLAASRRGHGAAQVVQAVAHLRRAGIRVGLQLMLGLPGDSTVRFLDTIARVAELAPDFVRLYPTVVIAGSGLADLTAVGRYRPLGLNRAVALAARAKVFFAQHDIPVARMGLQPLPELAAKVVAGPYHPAFGELVLARLFFKTARRLLAGSGPARLAVAAQDESALRGWKNSNIKRLQALGLLSDSKIEIVPDQARYTVQLIGNSPASGSIFETVRTV
ncbi:MAG: radical SAM protein [Desulfobacterales bacterium]|nr:radical SAM protein [Desulfobacterales bacterium]